MASIEFSAPTGKTFSLQRYNPISLAAIGTPIAVPETAVPNLYRVTFSGSGIVYAVASATNLTVSGYANLDRPGPNGYSELLETYEEASALGSITVPPQPTDLQPGDVRAGVVYLDSDGNSQTGTLVLPASGEVLEDVGYGSDGTEFVGTLASQVTVQAGLVGSDGQVRKTLWIGTDYKVSAGNGFEFIYPAPIGIALEDASVHFRGRKQCKRSDPYTWDVSAESTSVVTMGGVDYWRSRFNLTSELTSLITEGSYSFWVVVESLDLDIVVQTNRSDLPLLWMRG